MVKIPTYSGEFKKRALVTDAFTGFSGGEMQVASRTGITQAGKAINITAHHLRKIEEAKELKNNQLWITENFEKLDTEMFAYSIEAKKTNTDINAEGHTTNMLKKFQEISDEVLKNAPNKRAVEAWKIQMNKYKNKVANNATLYEAEQTIEGDKVKINNSLNYAAINAQNSFLETFEIIKRMELSFKALDNPNTKNIEGYSNRFTVAQIENFIDTGGAFISKSMINAVIERADFAEIAVVKKWLDDGKFDKLMDPNDIVQFKNKLDGIKKVKDGEFISNHKVKIDENFTEMLENGNELHTEVLSEMFEIHGENSVAAADYKKDLAMYESAYTEITKISSMSKNDMFAYAAGLADGNTRERKVKEVVMAKAEEISTLMEENPVLWAKKYRPDIYLALNVSETAQAAATEGDAEPDSTQTINAMNSLIEAQIAFGIPPWEVKVLSTDQSAAFADFIQNTKNAETLKGLFDLWKNQYGDNFDIIMNQMIQEDKLDPLWASAMIYLNDVEFAAIMKKGVFTKVDTSKLDSESKVELTSMQDELKVKFDDLRIALTKYNTRALPMVNGWEQLLLNYTAINYIKGNKTDPGQKAWENLIENKFHILDSLIIPRAENTKDKEMYESGMAHFKDNMLKDWNLDILKAGGILDDEINYLHFNKENQDINVFFRNTADGSGVELIWDGMALGTWPVSYTEKHPDDVSPPKAVVLTWKELNSYIDGVENLMKSDSVMEKIKKSKVPILWR